MSYFEAVLKIIVLDGYILSADECGREWAMSILIETHPEGFRVLGRAAVLVLRAVLVEIHFRGRGPSLKRALRRARGRCILTAAKEGRT